MLAVVSCTCNGSETLARGALQRGGCEYWLDVPIYQGKETFENFVDRLPEQIRESKDVDVLRFHVKESSSYVCIVGYTENKFVWSDIKHGGIKEMLDAEIIAKNFA